jgi:tRNA G18 (ribose-2'-O)-methylase SpoU
LPSIVTIDDPDDPRIAAYLDVRERDLAGRQGLFMAEGEVVLRVLVNRAPERTVSLLIAEKRLAALEPLIAGLPAGVPVFLASQRVLDRIVGFPMHRGILALGRRPPATSAEALLAGLGRRAVVLVLYGVANHDNVGGIFRNAAAFGADAVLLDAACCDPLYRKAIRVSVGASLVVPFARLEGSDSGLAALATHGFEPIALSPAGAIPLADLARPERVAILLGSEGHGLAEDVLARCRSVRIPMAEGFDSLNVGTASGIVLHHLLFQSKTRLG